MTISDAGLIDKEAQNILKASLPVEWFVRDQIPDHHIDYKVEVVSGREPTGFNFAVQLKGHGKLQVSPGIVLQSFKSKHLRYYLEKVRIPVFLIIVHVPCKKVYWLFLQKYLSELPDSSWKGKKTHTIKVPVSNEISDLPAFLEALNQSDIFMRNLRPGSPETAILAEEQKLSSIDPRFSVKFNYKDGLANYSVEPTSGSVKFQMQIKTDKESFSRLYDCGETIRLPKANFSLNCSPLFDYLLKKIDGDISISFSRKIAVEILAKVLDENGDVKKIVHGFQASIHGGRTQFQLNAYFPRAPLQFVSFFKINDKGLMTFDEKACFKFDLTVWDGFNITKLPYFDQVRSILEAVVHGKWLRFEVSFKGDHFFSFQGKDVRLELEGLNRYMSLIGQLRRICAYFKDDFMFNDVSVISDSDAKSICCICNYIDSGRMQLEMPEASIFSAKLDQGATWSHSLGVIRIEPINYPIKIIGKNVLLNHVKVELTGMRLQKCPVSLLLPFGPFEFHWSSTAATIVTISRCRPNILIGQPPRLSYDMV